MYARQNKYSIVGAVDISWTTVWERLSFISCHMVSSGFHISYGLTEKVLKGVKRFTYG